MIGLTLTRSILGSRKQNEDDHKPVWSVIPILPLRIFHLFGGFWRSIYALMGTET